MKLKELRNSKGLSLAQLSKISGIPQRTIEDIERKGGDNTRVKTAIVLADALQVTLDELCRD